MHILHDKAGHKIGAFDENGACMGEIFYTPKSDNIIEADQTLVLEKFQGKGVARNLLDALVKHAAVNGLKIAPVCPYVAAAFNKDPERYRHVMLS